MVQQNGLPLTCNEIEKTEIVVLLASCCMIVVSG